MTTDDNDDELPGCFGAGASGDCMISCPCWEECEIAKDDDAREDAFLEDLAEYGEPEDWY